MPGGTVGPCVIGGRRGQGVILGVKTPARLILLLRCHNKLTLPQCSSTSGPSGH